MFDSWEAWKTRCYTLYSHLVGVRSWVNALCWSPHPHRLGLFWLTYVEYKVRWDADPPILIPFILIPSILKQSILISFIFIAVIFSSSILISSVHFRHKRTSIQKAIKQAFVLKIWWPTVTQAIMQVGNYHFKIFISFLASITERLAFRHPMNRIDSF